MKRLILKGQNFFLLYIVFFTALILICNSVSVTADELQNRSFKDMANRSVVVKGTVNKIVTTFKPSTLCVLSLGLQDRLVGVDSSSKRDRLSLAVYPAISEVKGIGSKSMGINFETLVALKPDLVILYSQKDGLSLADRLESMGIPSIIIFPETFKTIKESMQLIARAVGEPERTLPAEKQMDEIIKLTQERFKGLEDKDKKTGYFSSANGIFSTTTGNMLQDEIFNQAGIINVSHYLKGYFQTISPEQLMEWNPDIMVLSQHMKKSEIKLLDNKALKKITAVSQKDVYRCPSSLAPWDFPSPMSVLASLWIACKVYPERFSDLDFKKTVNNFHYNLFGKSLSEMGGTLDDRVY